MKTKKTSAFGLEQHPFWQFSLTIYSRTAVKEACLALQSSCGINVNLLLLCCWVGHTGRGVFTKAELAKGLQAIDNWHRTFTLGLRNLRNRLNSFPAVKISLQKFRQALLNQEIAAEHVEQLLLMQTFSKPSNEALPDIKKLQDTIVNIKLYLEILPAKLKEQDRLMLSQLLVEVFAEMPKHDVVQQCRLFSP